MPDAVGVPLIVIVFDAKEAVTPAGKLVALPMPVAPVVECVMFVRGELIQTVGEDEAAPTARLGVTVTTVAAEVVLHPLTASDTLTV